MRKAAIALVGQEHPIDARFILDAVSVGPDHPFPHVVKTAEIESGVFFYQHPFQFEYLVRVFAQHFPRVFVRALVKKWWFFEGLGDISIAVVAEGDGGIPGRVYVHQSHGKKIASGFHDGQSTHHSLQSLQGNLDVFAFFGSDDKINFLLGSQNFD